MERNNEFRRGDVVKFALGGDPMLVLMTGPRSVLVAWDADPGVGKTWLPNCAVNRQETHKPVDVSAN